MPLEALARISLIQHVAAMVAPVFGVIVIGLMCARLGVLSDGAAKTIVEFVFRVAVPALMFRTMALAPPPESSPLALWGAFFDAIAVVWLLATLASRFVLRRPATDTAALPLAASFGNLVLLGLPIVFGYLGTAAATPAALILLVEFPLMWLAATVQLQIALGRAPADTLAAIRRLALDLGRNPIILGLAAGVLWRLTGLGLASVRTARWRSSPRLPHPAHCSRWDYRWRISESEARCRRPLPSSS